MEKQKYSSAVQLSVSDSCFLRRKKQTVYSCLQIAVHIFVFALVLIKNTDMRDASRLFLLMIYVYASVHIQCAETIFITRIVHATQFSCMYFEFVLH